MGQDSEPTKSLRRNPGGSFVRWVNVDMNEDPPNFSSPNERHVELLLLHESYRTHEDGKACTSIRDAVANDPYSYCGRRLHVALLTKMISIAVLPYYLFIVIFISFCGNATCVMICINIYRLWRLQRSKKMCLIPFLILQVVFFAYDLVLVALFLFAVIHPNCFLSSLIHSPLVDVPVNADHALLCGCLLLVLLLAPLIWTTHVVYIDFLFISQIDEALHLLKEANQKISQDEMSPSRMNF
ncbi:unnamed protein product [Caenorhabditis auriculariae]|uniref:Uncharacterized protein n=1 Tax=Caenorhabditis auriculariae TaxID=2777116 RepID=A0A8S1GNV4_9PELO|nr:unnamed protein product [Caenorhabditis auriculariae]